MSAPAKALTLTEVPAEVLSFAAEKGVSEYLYPVLEIAARAYAGLTIKLFVDYDYEEPDMQYIVVEADTSGYTVEEFSAAKQAWGTEFVHSIPPAARPYFINGAR